MCLANQWSSKIEIYHQPEHGGTEKEKSVPEIKQEGRSTERHEKMHIAKTTSTGKYPEEVTKELKPKEPNDP